jgi:hypothetical protein
MIIKTDNPVALREILAKLRGEAEIISIQVGKPTLGVGKMQAQIPLFPKPGTKRKEPPIVDTSWWGEEQLVPALRQVASACKILTPVVDADGLRIQLDQVIHGEEGGFIIPMNVNVIAGELGSRQANHWVGLHIVKQQEGIVVNYVDPMGRVINDQVQNTVMSILDTHEINCPLSGRAIQKVEESRDASGKIVEVTGNINDCGPMLVCAMDCIIHPDKPLPEVMDMAASKALGQHIRRVLVDRGIAPKVTQEGIAKSLVERVKKIRESVDTGTLIPTPPPPRLGSKGKTLER